MRRVAVLASHLRDAREEGSSPTAAVVPQTVREHTPRPLLEPHQRFPFNQPLSGNVMSRFGGITTMMRLPLWPRESPQLGPDNYDSARQCAAGLDACFVGVPIDIGASNRAGTRHGPRAIRTESAILRPFNMATGAAPFESLQVADVGDVGINTYSLTKSIETITGAFQGLICEGCVPLTMGGDHSITYPILRAIAERHGPVAVLHIAAHPDTLDTVGGEKIAHGTSFRRAVEDGLLTVRRSCRWDCVEEGTASTSGSGAAGRASSWSLRTVYGRNLWSR